MNEMIFETGVEKIAFEIATVCADRFHHDEIDRHFFASADAMINAYTDPLSPFVHPDDEDQARMMQNLLVTMPDVRKHARMLLEYVIENERFCA